jgi:hypothetical protein
VTVSAAILGLAEDADTYTPLGRGQERIARDEYVLWMMPGLGEAHGAVAQRLRLRPERVEPVVAELREIVRSRDRIALSWEIGSSAKPSHLVERLLALGMRLDDDPHLVAVVCTSPPEPGPAGRAHVCADPGAARLLRGGADHRLDRHAVSQPRRCRRRANSTR